MSNIDVRYSKAFSEVLCILDNLTDELCKLIPKSFINLVEENSDKTYIVNEEYLKNNGMMPETQAILSLIYRDFFCSDEIRDELLKSDEIELNKEIGEYNAVFKRSSGNKLDNLEVNIKEERDRKIEDNIVNNNKLAVLDESKWYKNILKKIKSLFKHFSR